MNSLFEQYIANIDAYYELENETFAKGNIVPQIMEVCQKKRLIKQDNDRILATLKEYENLQGIMSADKFADLSKFSKDLDEIEHRRDISVAKRVQLILANDAKLRKDTRDYLWRLRYLCNIQYYSYLNYAILSQDTSFNNEYLIETLKYEDNYYDLKIQDKDHILCAKDMANFWYYIREPNLFMQKRIEILQQLQEYMLGENSADERRNKWLATFYRAWVHRYEARLAEASLYLLSCPSPDPNSVSAVVAICDKLKENYHMYSEDYRWITNLSYVNIYQATGQYLAGKIDANELVTRVGQEVVNTENDTSSFRIFDIAATYLNVVFALDVEDEVKQTALAQVLENAKQASGKMKISPDYRVGGDYGYTDFFSTVKKYCNYPQVRDLAFELLINRHKSTYIHTAMVVDIVEAITQKILEKDKHYFDGCFEQKIEDEGEIINRIKEMSLMHDIGKHGCMTFIRNSSRSLTDEEFSMIKQHPNFGIALLPESAPKHVKDAILYHHVWHNGKGGYPANLPPTNNQPIIDIISIADSIDAATDYIGRPYSHKKSLDELMEEFKGFAGTRYSEKVVDLLYDPLLMQRLRHLIQQDRERLINSAYSNQNI